MKELSVIFFFAGLWLITLITIDRFIVVRYGTLLHFVLIMNCRASTKLVGMLFLLSYKMKESGFSAEIGICHFCLYKEIMHLCFVCHKEHEEYYFYFYRFPLRSKSVCSARKARWASVLCFVTFTIYTFPYYLYSVKLKKSYCIALYTPGALVPISVCQFRQ